MLNKNELDIMPGIYKCYGDIKYLRLKIRLEIIKSSMIPLSNVEEHETGLDPQLNEREEFEFAWNEKIFSPREFKYYGDEKNCKTDVEAAYHEKVQKLVADGTVTPGNRIFTYASEDTVPINLRRYLFYPDDHRECGADISPSAITRRFVSSEKSRDVRSLPARNIVDHDPSDDLRAQNRSLLYGYETMYILADLSDKSQCSNGKVGLSDCSECLLVTLKWNRRTCTLTVTPDFAFPSTIGYKIDYDTLGDTRYVYRYWLWNTSKIEEEDHLQKVEKFTDEFVSRQKNANVSSDFEVPFKNVENVFVFLEIQKAVGFTGPNLFVQYFVHLPGEWSASNPDLLSGISQQCRNRKADGIVFFSYVFELKFSRMISQNLTDDNDHSNEKAIPQLFFEICSLDSWKRFRVEGYGWTALPSSAGRHKLIVDTWRPAPLTRRDELKRFFIGSDPQIFDVTYSGVAADHPKGLLGRYGFETISAGTIHAEMNVLRQTGAAASISKTKTRLPDRKASILMNSVNHILEAFKKARQRMLLAREPILLHAE